MPNCIVLKAIDDPPEARLNQGLNVKELCGRFLRNEKAGNLDSEHQKTKTKTYTPKYWGI